MKHTRKILSSMASQPAVESAAYLAIPEGDENDLGALALEAYALTNEVTDQLNEASIMEDKTDRGEMLVDYIGSQVINNDRVATQNELALIEQATDAIVDGTGETVDSVLPSLESFMVKGAAQPSMESLTGTISDFAKAAATLVSNAAKSFGKYVKGMFDRIQALKNKVENVEALLKDVEFEESVTISKSQAVPLAYNDNSYVSDYPKAVDGLEAIGKLTTVVSGQYTKGIYDSHDKYLKKVMDLFKGGRGRGADKETVRADLRSKFLDSIDELGALFDKTFKDGKAFGGLYIENAKTYKKSDDLLEASKKILAAVPDVYRAGNISERAIEMGSFSKESARRACQIVKSNIRHLSEIKESDSMWAVDFYTDVDFDVFEYLFTGVSSTQFFAAVNRINRAYVQGLVQPSMEVINHFFRVAEANLNAVKKAAK